MYLLAATIGLLSLAIVAAFAPGPSGSGLKPVAAERIRLMEPGDQHQARNPASANWSVGFTDQFRFNGETARHRAEGTGNMRVSLAERQWHFTLTAPESGAAPLALYIANASGELDLHVNGSRLAEGIGQPAYFGPGIGGTAMAAQLTAQALNPERNRIDVIQSGDPAHTGIRAIYLGAPAAVEAARQSFARWLEWHRLGASIAAAAGLIGAGLLMLTGQQRMTAAALAVLACGQALSLSETAAQAVPGWSIAALTAIAAGVIGICHIRPRGPSDGLVLGLALPAVLAGLAGLALDAGVWLADLQYQVLQLANAGARPLLLLGAPTLVWHEGRAVLDRLRQARAELDRRDQIIIAQQQALDAEIRNAAILEERQRFARDMHDGIGGHLQALLMRVRAGRIGPGEIAAELHSGLSDLRLMVDSLDQIDTSLDLALANFRLRAGPQLDAAGITLDWHVATAVSAIRLDPRATLSLYRILQELVTNCVRHSGSTKLAVAIECDPVSSLFSASLTDNGQGFDPGAVKAGKGLANMRKRLELLGGSLVLTSVPGAGTRASFELPVSAAGS